MNNKNTNTSKIKHLKDLTTAGMPRIDYTLEDGRKITMRAFAVKELKLLLMASAAGNAQDFQVLQVLSQCIDQDIDLELLPAHEVECLYLELYKLSKGSSIVPVSYKCTNEIDGQPCGEHFTVNLNLNSVVKFDQTPRQIELVDGVTLNMRLPNTREREYFSEDTTRDAFNMAMACIESVETPSETMVVGIDIEREELAELIEYMDTRVFSEIMTWITTLPTLQLHVPVCCPKCRHTEVIALEGLGDFFD
ncbi:T4 family baseplate hub assembly chaperone [Photobacterium damselae]|uniref:T4 family baseplate hub assembly chaperone n=1 Tax=Photobacterium damselae TaxID=38293 RepID=UPI00370CB619